MSCDLFCFNGDTLLRNYELCLSEAEEPLLENPDDVIISGAIYFHKTLFLWVCQFFVGAIPMRLSSRCLVIFVLKIWVVQRCNRAPVDVYGATLFPYMPPFPYGRGFSVGFLCGMFHWIMKVFSPRSSWYMTSVLRPEILR